MLEVRDLTHRFGDVVAVDDLSFGVRAGKIVGLVGRNGAGKTTTMRAVMGIVRPIRGAIEWEGHPVAFADRLRFGYMPEERGLYPQMRVLDQVSYFARLHGADGDAAARAARSWLVRLGLGDRGQERLVALSHGNQQRVQLAVALVHAPKLLVLDEPFAGLDPEAVDALSAILRERADEGVAVLFSSHQLELVERLCERVVIVEQGRRLAAGTLAELRGQFPALLRVRVAGSSEWANRLDGARAVRADAEGVLLEIGAGVDAQAILRAAQAAGPVEHFAFESGSLSDTYRRLMP